MQFDTEWGFKFYAYNQSSVSFRTCNIEPMQDVSSRYAYIMYVGTYADPASEKSEHKASRLQRVSIRWRHNDAEYMLLFHWE